MTVRKEYREALKIYGGLAQKDPETYLSYVALAHNNLANLDSVQNQMEKAGKEYQEALKIYRKLAQKNPEIYQSEVATKLNNLGLLDSARTG